MKAELIDKMGSDQKICRGCAAMLSLTDFPIRKDRSGRHRPYCITCMNDIAQARYNAYRERDYFKWKCTKTKSRSQSLRVPFDLTPEYLENIWTTHCPITNVEFDKTNRASENYPELDRFIPGKGYIKGNVTFLSRRINRIKSDVTWGELIKLMEWMKLKQN